MFGVQTVTPGHHSAATMTVQSLCTPSPTVVHLPRYSPLQDAQLRLRNATHDITSAAHRQSRISPPEDVLSTSAADRRASYTYSRRTPPGVPRNAIETRTDMRRPMTSQRSSPPREVVHHRQREPSHQPHHSFMIDDILGKRTSERRTPSPTPLPSVRPRAWTPPPPAPRDKPTASPPGVVVPAAHRPTLVHPASLPAAPVVYKPQPHVYDPVSVLGTPYLNAAHLNAYPTASSLTSPPLYALGPYSRPELAFFDHRTQGYHKGSVLMAS